MSIIYSLVSRGSTVLAEYTEKTGNFTTITQSIIEKIPPQDTKMTYVYDRYLFHYVSDSGYVYLCMAEEEFGRRVPFAYLQEIKDRFEGAFKGRAATSIAYGLNREFAPVLKQQMEFFSKNPSADKLTQVKQEINQVKDVMVQNIEKVLERGERIELLVDKTENLNEQAVVFKRHSTKLKKKMWWKNVKMMLLLGFTVAIILTIIIVAAVKPWEK
eukprot:Opistho-2@10815